MAVEITPTLAREIEVENGLASGSVAAAREATQEESIYLSVPACPMLSCHVDLLGACPALVVYEQDILSGRDGNASHRRHLEGAGFATPMLAAEDVKLQWVGLQVARQGGLVQLIGEDLSVTFTSWVENQPGQRFSWSVMPGNVRNLFQGAPRRLLLGPKFVPLPAPAEEGAKEGAKSPGLAIQGLTVSVVVFVHSILYQGVTTMKHYDGAGLRDLAKIAEQGRL